jgi:hypothetical protein
MAPSPRVDRRSTPEPDATLGKLDDRSRKVVVPAKVRRYGTWVRKSEQLRHLSSAHQVFGVDPR